ncbi:trichothecene C-8 hydroxylase [Beauveria brongniartii RCEF 3172]|uniref:Trichothecene C-8 hydroxylase n=1 Tax=Beauveria brongniartii RCEF 3172 TaxID=1081107 RepID=A0A166XPM0_9HYPO|nr:trichothecene C-8 hydroxylase [Beauveria brongniartii RCEF 3172]
MIAGLLSFVKALPCEVGANLLPIIIASVIAAYVALHFRMSFNSNAVPCINPKSTFELSGNRVKSVFMRDGARLIKEWFSKNPDKPVRVYGDSGPMLILPSSMAQEIRNDQRLNFSEVTEEAFHAHLPGFEPFKLGESDHLIVKVVRKNLTKQLSKVTGLLAQETSLTLKDLLTDSIEWHEAVVCETILQLVARVSSRVFIGDELCRNDDWLKIVKEYTVTALQAAEQLRMWSPILRPIAVRFLDSCVKTQGMVAEARRVIKPVIDKRYKARADAAAANVKYVESHDAMDWFATADPENLFEPATSQLALSFVVIQTTTDLLSETLFQISKHPNIIPALREEIITIYRSDGWEKTAFYKMKLLDSVVKETQRFKPHALISMTRLVKENFVLSDGTPLKKGQKIAVTSTNMRDKTNYANPDEWDPYRFVKMRDDPVKQNAAHLVSTSVDHNAFGLGQHACPGRFFAANEIKVALVSILIKYDFELPADVSPQIYENGLALVSDPLAKLRFRRRVAEIDLDNV